MVSFTDYPSFVVFLAVFLGAILTKALMPVFIRFLRRRLIGHPVRADGHRRRVFPRRARS